MNDRTGGMTDSGSYPRLRVALAGFMLASAPLAAWAQMQPSPEEMQIQQMQSMAADGLVGVVLLIQGAILLAMILIPVVILLIARRNMQGWRQPVKYVWFSFDGRLNRKAYWLKGVVLLSLVIFVVQLASLLLTQLLMMPLHLDEAVGSVVSLVFMLPLIVFQLWASSAVMVKRAHDLDHSGWWLLTMLIPLWNFWVAIQLAFFRGASGANSFGEDPLDDDDGEGLKGGPGDDGEEDEAPRVHTHAPQPPQAPKGFGSRKFAGPKAPVNPQTQGAPEPEPAHPLATHADMDTIKNRLGPNILRPIDPKPHR
ncbi:MAG: DUF805 domain-containing protein [Rhodospirillales bacterium]|nr:DUF805 domain-containing protein [Rhodospirillales bacterium]